MIVIGHDLMVILNEDEITLMVNALRNKPLESYHEPFRAKNYLTAQRLADDLERELDKRNR